MKGVSSVQWLLPVKDDGKSLSEFFNICIDVCAVNYAKDGEEYDFTIYTEGDFAVYIDGERKYFPDFNMIEPYTDLYHDFNDNESLDEFMMKTARLDFNMSFNDYKWVMVLENDPEGKSKIIFEDNDILSIIKDIEDGKYDEQISNLISNL